MVVQNSLFPLIQIITNFFIVIALVSLLVLNNPKLSLIAFLTLVVTYVLTYTFVRQSLKHIGDERLKINYVLLL